MPNREKKRLQEHVDRLDEELDALYEQRDQQLSKSDQIRITRAINDLKEQLAQAEAELEHHSDVVQAASLLGSEPAQQPNIPTPFITGKPVPPDRFYGRVEQRMRVKQRIGAIEPQCLSIIGMRRSGKSSLLRYIRERPQEFFQPDHQPLLVSFDLQDKCYHTPHGINEGLRRGIKARTGTSPWESDENDDGFAICDGLEALRDQGRRLVILIDEFENIGNLEEFQEWGDDWRSKANNNLFALVITSMRPLEEIYKSLHLTSPFGNIFTSTYLGPLEPDAWQSLVQDGFVNLSHGTVEHAIDVIDELAGGMPFYVQIAAELIWSGYTESQVRERFAHEVKSHFTHLWNKLYEHERHTIKAIATGQGIPDKKAVKNLQLYGIVREDGRLFSSVFAEGIAPHP